MKDTQLKQLLNLIRRTGERCFVVDNESNDIFALMTLSDYEKFLNGETGQNIAKLNEEEMLDKINRDVAYWRSTQPQNDDLPDFELKKERKMATTPKMDKITADNMIALSDVLKKKQYFSSNSEENIDNRKPKLIETEKTVSDLSNHFSVEEPLTDLPEDGTEEEKFYLEPVE